MIALAREILASGEIGEASSFRHPRRGLHGRQRHAMALAADPAVGGGVVQDLGTHIIAMARHLVGPIVEVSAQVETVVKARPTSAGSSETRPVEVDDIARALVHFARGCSGTLEASWVSAGRKMQIEFELVGSKGALHFNQERFNELRLYQSAGDGSRNGFRTILAGPEHRPMAPSAPRLDISRLQRPQDHRGARLPAGERASWSSVRTSGRAGKSSGRDADAWRERAWVTVG
jgi:predicted dehydrogenase